MILKIFCLTTLFTFIQIFPQNSLKGKVVDEHSGNPVPGVNILISGTGTGASTDNEGEFHLENIENGKQVIEFRHIAYSELSIELTFPLKENYIEIEMEEEAAETEEIFVNATRSSRTIENEPTRVEVIAGEEIDEKLSMDPSNISMMLNESTGIQVQQTSAAGANNSFRIQGLEGRYTQLLKDGFPLYSGFSGSLSIVQIPPLDLKQIEIIKGSSSTLYGGGAIAGLINLISKEPEYVREISFLLNGTSALGIDASGYYSARTDKTGITLLAGHNYQKAYDNNDDQYSDLPRIERYILNPKIYFYFNEDSRLFAGFNYAKEDRHGGAIPVINNDESNPLLNYFERNNSDRLSVQTGYISGSAGNQLNIKGSVGYFNRDLSLHDYNFSGLQLSTYGEISYQITNSNSSWIFGLNTITENFDDKSVGVLDRGYKDFTAGIFIQNNLDAGEIFSLETGLRGDYNNEFGTFILPRAAILARWTNNFSSRVGGGLGYKIPDFFTESAEQVAFRNIMPLMRENMKAEKSYGFNLDFNYNKIIFNEITFSVNQLFFYTRINNPLKLSAEASGEALEFISSPGYNDTRGIETNLKFTLDDIKFFAGYTYTDVREHEGDSRIGMPLAPKNRLGLILIYEQHGSFRVGLEGYYTGRQKLSTGAEVTDYWINGIMLEKRFGNINLFLNFENIFDTRQSNYGPMFTGSGENPVFAEIYAPTDGRIINGGIKLRL